MTLSKRTESSSAPRAAWMLASRGVAAIRMACGFGVVLLCAVLAGCASSPPVAVPPGAFEPLAADEGFFVVGVDTEVAVERIAAGGQVFATELQPGQHLWLVRMKAGSARWTAVDLVPQLQADTTIRPKAGGVLNEREFEFEIEAGAVNYAGDLVIRLRSARYGIGSGFTVRNRNHSAMAIRKLAKTHAELLAAHPIRYAGSSGDEFLEHYTSVRDRRRKDERRASTEGGRAK